MAGQDGNLVTSMVGRLCMEPDFWVAPSGWGQVRGLLCRVAVRSEDCGGEGHKLFPSCEDNGTHIVPS